jgi:ribosomal protein L37E
MTREEWLQKAISELKPLFHNAGKTLPDVRVSCGFPSRRARASKNRRIGECWSAEASGDGTPEIFISPLEDDPVEVLAILVHELIHGVGIHGHGRDFRAVALLVGLEGRMTATRPSEALSERLRGIVAEIGPYPHAKLDASLDTRKQPTRLIKCECSSCGYIIRTTNKWLKQSGPPICPTCDIEFEVHL